MPKVELKQGDCLEIMRDMEDGCVDVIVTSPPYNLGKIHHTGSKGHIPYKDNLPEDEYQNWQIEVLNECFRVLDEDGSLLYNHKNRIRQGVQISPYEWLFKTKFVIKQEVVWFNGSQNFAKIRFYPMTERVYWLTKNPKTTLFNAINHHDFFSKKEWPAVGTNVKHTRSFPENMAHDLLSCFPDKKVVFDPFMGSGTTGVAAKALGKDFIGAELSGEYIEIAEERIANEGGCCG